MSDGLKDDRALRTLPSKPVQISSTNHVGTDQACGAHMCLFALCADGSIWVQYHGTRYANVPEDGLWREVNAAEITEPPATESDKP